MDKVRKIVSEELSKLNEQGSFSDNNYGLPSWFNLLKHSEKMEEERNQAFQVLQELVNINLANNLSNQEKYNRMVEVIRKWERMP